MSHGSLVALFAVMMLPGMVGVVVPVFPGIPFMFAVALVFGFVDKFAYMQWWELGVLLLLTLLSVLVDYSAGMLGARYGGASRKSALFGLLGLIVGLIVFPPLGGLIGLFVGVLLAEFYLRREGRHALRAATGSLLGAVAGIVANLLLAVLFLGLFIVFAL